MKAPSFAGSVINEWTLISTDRWLTALLCVLPMGLFLLVWAIFSAGTARDLPIGVVDMDNSAMSRALVRYYDANPTIATTKFGDVQRASASLNRAETFATIVIPERFEASVIRGESPDVTAFYNSQYILIGKLVSSAIMQSQSTYAAMVETKARMLQGTTIVAQAAGQSLPVRFQLVPLFNSGTNYAQFLVSAIIPALWQIAIVASGMLSMALTDKRIGFVQAFANHASKALAAKFCSLLLPLWLMGIAFALSMHMTLGWPMNGSWLIVFAVQGLMVSAGLAIGALLYSATRNVVRAMSLVAGFTAPAFAFMGVSFPATDMPFLAQCWRAMLPASHYISLQIGQFNYGATLKQATPEILALACFSALWAIVYIKVRRIANGASNKNMAVSK
ncbi:ABC transporter permease [Enterovibrio nigricans]|uniref:ABC-2 type transport system permease protein n=1 Tax=Enterovibrio nigricans DSM 22720 TaxID=1121868 RepID=A0A1T4VDI3_9GAMM|nr:ABC transporter permease [Enterovibrio nigricans]PKF49942.1 ABC transporter permease [Enterovibrio nigricans]SKA62621.1 ABC-2 type transport system permease protein [Enterovibrio nigricans DSM 22720]